MKLRQKIANLIKSPKPIISTPKYEFGSPVPAPPEVKRRTIFDYAKVNKIDTLIETGTFRGDTVQAALPLFSSIFSIEVDSTLAEQAKKRFQDQDKVKIIYGDSGKVLSEILVSLNKQAVFWLDGHYSGGITGKGSKNTPILEELKNILRHPIKDHVILIDDARCFTGEFDYPTLFEIYEMVKAIDSKYQLNVKDDIIRIIYVV